MLRARQMPPGGDGEAPAHARGAREGPVARVPEHVDVKAIRARLGLSQAKFAARFGFTPAAVRNWEQARRQPDAAARAFLTVIDRESDAVVRALAPAAGRKLDRERIIAIIRRHSGEIRARGVARLGLFGPAARGDANDDSVIDVVIDLEPDRKFSLVDLAGLRAFLCEALQRETKVIIREDHRPAFREAIERERVPVLYLQSERRA